MPAYAKFKNSYDTIVLFFVSSDLVMQVKSVPDVCYVPLNVSKSRSSKWERQAF